MAYFIGQSMSGGTIFYTGTTSSGLIAATQDIHLKLSWGCPKVGIVTSTDIGSGQANTVLILSGCTGNTMIAATYCDNLTLNGSDWFLPSKDELNQLYLQKDVVGNVVEEDNYWSSSQYNPECAWIQYFRNGTQSGLGGKEQFYRVRPIKAY